MDLLFDTKACHAYIAMCYVFLCLSSLLLVHGSLLLFKINNFSTLNFIMMEVTGKGRAKGLQGPRCFSSTYQSIFLKSSIAYLLFVVCRSRLSAANNKSSF